MEICIKNNKPVIAVFGSRAANRKVQIIRVNYMTSLANAGAIPILAPMFATEEDYKQLSCIADGFFFSGGVDIHPHRYGREVREECGEIDEERDQSEFDAFSAIKETGKPVFGVCRGIQTLNVLRGGTLWQDLPSQRPSDLIHSQKTVGSVRTHGVRVEKGTLLYDIVGKESFDVNSFHHQAVRTTNLTVSAYATDGLIEAVEDADHKFFLGVQWHPEYTSEIDEESAKLFKAFVDSAK